jgi:hypothetical protein
LAECEPSKGSGLAGSEKKKIGFCIMVETFGNLLCCGSKSQSLIYSVYILINFVSLFFSWHIKKLLPNKYPKGLQNVIFTFVYKYTYLAS